MASLQTTLRNQLASTITRARREAEAGARKTLGALAVAQAKPHESMTPGERALRNRLRAHGRQLGDTRDREAGVQLIGKLVHEVAYQHWHRMLFARFLAENGLLIEPDSGVAITPDECEELAREAGMDPHALAAGFAQSALPQIFRAGDPVLDLMLAPETRLTLERLLDDLPQEVFTADDSLGWTYQFWQSEKKKAVNDSGDKIGADELPAVTQLFTEHYMVQFLFHNTIGAWHAGKVLVANPSLAKTAQSEDELRRAVRLRSQGGYDFEYLRFVKVDAASRRVDETPPSTEATFGFFHKDEAIGNLSGNLPHWRQATVTYFVTFRTADSLPRQKLKKWMKEREAWLTEHPEPHDEATRSEYYERFPERFQKWLDANHGVCVLDLPEVRSIVDGALRHFDGVRYHLDEYVVMPNHVHAVVTPIGEHTLSTILHTWKSFTAHEILKVDAASSRVRQAANHHGWETPRVWQKESFDHIVRSPDQLERIRKYIRDNPRVDAAPRRVEETRRDAASTIWRPAAGAFEGWPQTARELKVLDPCCGSGHFLTEGFELLVRLRMDEDSIGLEDAIRGVLADNLHGLELDPRCTQIAAFNVAMAAWKLAGRPIELPALHIACSGLAPNASKAEWLALAEEAAAAGGTPSKRDLFGVEETLLSARLKGDLSAFYDLFAKAPVLGSLIDPRANKGPLFEDDFAALEPLLAAAFEGERGNTEQVERAVAAQGMARAAELLAGRYTLVITNVPYLKRGHQAHTLREFGDLFFKEARADLATMFLCRMVQWLGKGGTLGAVTPQNWLFQTSYTMLREKLLNQQYWNLLARLGPGAFETITGHVVNVALPVITTSLPSEDSMMAGIDASSASTPSQKAAVLRGESDPSFGGEQADGVIRLFPQEWQLMNPDSRIVMDEAAGGSLLVEAAESVKGLTTGDGQRFIRYLWELPRRLNGWEWFQSTVQTQTDFGGSHQMFLWEDGSGEMQSVPGSRTYARGAWGTEGVLVSQMGHLLATRYLGCAYDNNCAVLKPRRSDCLSALWAFCLSGDFTREVRRIDHALKATNASFEKIPFDLNFWQKVAAKKYPNGLPEPQSDDPTQWLFHGHPAKAEPATVLQVAVGRLLGYRWPPEQEVDAASRRVPSPSPGQLATRDKSRDGSSTMHLADEAREWVARCDVLKNFADEDGIVCLSAIRGERSAADRLRELLSAALGADWSAAKERDLLAVAANGKKPADSLDIWLRDRFFEEHCKLFHNRPFIWHIWDGDKDGFHCLVNAHKLTGPDGKGRRTLESITYSYLGDWIGRQKADQMAGKEGVDGRLAAALDLQGQLEKILEGEPPYDLFVRWKPLDEQAIGWAPDINDGVRLNARPFMSAELRKGGKKGAGILRWKPNIKWNKDRGKEPLSLRPKADFPWFWNCPGDGTAEERTDFGGGPNFDGNRWNDLHYSNDTKRASHAKRKED